MLLPIISEPQRTNWLLEALSKIETATNALEEEGTFLTGFFHSISICSSMLIKNSLFWTWYIYIYIYIFFSGTWRLRFFCFVLFSPIYVKIALERDLIFVTLRPCVSWCCSSLLFTLLTYSSVRAKVSSQDEQSCTAVYLGHNDRFHRVGTNKLNFFTSGSGSIEFTCLWSGNTKQASLPTIFPICQELIPKWKEQNSA